MKQKTKIIINLSEQDFEDIQRAKEQETKEIDEEISEHESEFIEKLKSLGWKGNNGEGWGQ